jgi:type III secretion protein J
MMIEGAGRTLVRGVFSGGLALVSALLVGCAVPVEAGLDDAEANRVFLALDRAGVDATKEQDPSADGRWRISVAREDVARALVAMKDDALPRSPSTGAEPSKGALVPSEAAERAQMLSATAERLRSSLESIEGVLEARVHLAEPDESGGLLRDNAPPFVRGSASVLFAYRGATPPISADAVQRLVAGAVAGLAATDVSVVMVPVTAPATPSGGVLGHVGPIAVARSSIPRLQAALAALASVSAVLAAAVLLLMTRLARMRAEAAVAAQRAANDGEDSGPREQTAALRRGVS